MSSDTQDHQHAHCPHCEDIQGKIEAAFTPIDARLKRMEESDRRMMTAIVGDNEMGTSGLVTRVHRLEKEVGSFKVMKAKAMVYLSIGTAMITAFFVKLVSVFGFDLFKGGK
jgi:hypothetical protein